VIYVCAPLDRVCYFLSLAEPVTAKRTSHRERVIVCSQQPLLGLDTHSHTFWEYYRLTLI
jgi:hypothetical protein